MQRNREADRELVTIRLTREEWERLFADLACALRCMADEQMASPLFSDRHQLQGHRRSLCRFYWKAMRQEQDWLSEEELSFWHRLLLLLFRLRHRATPAERPGVEHLAKELAAKIKAGGYEEFWDGGES